MNKLHPVVAVIAFAVLLVAVAGGTFLLGRFVRGAKHPAPQHIVPAPSSPVKGK